MHTYSIMCMYRASLVAHGGTQGAPKGGNTSPAHQQNLSPSSFRPGKNPLLLKQQFGENKCVYADYLF